MGVERLLGADVKITVSDPWDFVTENGAGPFPGKVLRAGPCSWDPGQGCVLLELDSPPTWSGAEVRYLVVSPRHEGKDLEDILHCPFVPANFSRIPEERALGANPLDLSWWRGGIELIGALKKR